MTGDPVQRFYRLHARIYDATRWAVLPGRGTAVARLQLRHDSRVLEIGCGTGRNFATILARLRPPNGALTGVDFSPDMLRVAHRRVMRRGWTNVDLVAADATQLHLNRRFDAILFAYSLSMIPGWRTSLEIAARHLEPGGRVVILDFGSFERWGPLRPLLRAWLRLNHVEVGRPYGAELSRYFANTASTARLGGYYAITSAD